MSYLVTCLLCVVGVELFIFLPVLGKVGDLSAVSQKTMRVLSSSHISDHWKEKVLQRYARDMAVSSIAIGLLLVLLSLIVSAVALGLDMLLDSDPPSLEYLLTTPGLVIATGFSLLYVYVRKRFVST